MQDDEIADFDALVNTRTHLTRALLAATLLHRRHGASPDVEHLCGHIIEAIRHTEREISALERRLARREDRKAS